jgi:hypothetical protein
MARQLRTCLCSSQHCNTGFVYRSCPLSSCTFSYNIDMHTWYVFILIEFSNLCHESDSYRHFVGTCSSVALRSCHHYSNGLFCPVLHTRLTLPRTKLKKKLNSMVWVREWTIATAACRRSDCQLLRIESATWSAWRIPMAVFSIS